MGGLVGGWVSVCGGGLYLTLHCHHQNDSTLRMTAVWAISVFYQLTWFKSEDSALKPQLLRKVVSWHWTCLLTSWALYHGACLLDSSRPVQKYINSDINTRKKRRRKKRKKACWPRFVHLNLTAGACAYHCHCRMFTSLSVGDFLIFVVSEQGKCAAWVGTIQFCLLVSGTQNMQNIHPIRIACSRHKIVWNLGVKMMSPVQRHKIIRKIANLGVIIFK